MIQVVPTTTAKALICLGEVLAFAFALLAFAFSFEHSVTGLQEDLLDVAADVFHSFGFIHHDGKLLVKDHLCLPGVVKAHQISKQIIIFRRSI